MSYFPHDLFSSTTTISYKTCLIVIETPQSSGADFLCKSRIVLGGRLNLPLPLVSGATAEEARQAALHTARRTVDRLETGPSGPTG
jgi:hypothetical protein